MHIYHNIKTVKTICSIAKAFPIFRLQHRVSTAPEYRQAAGWSSRNHTASYTSPVSCSTPGQRREKSRTGKRGMFEDVSERDDVQLFWPADRCSRWPTARMAVRATSLLMRPSVRALRARLMNHMQGTQNLLWGECKSSRYLSSSDVINPEGRKHGAEIKGCKREHLRRLFPCV